MKRLDIGDKAFIYFEGYEVRGVIVKRNYHPPSTKPCGEILLGEHPPYKGDYWNYSYKMLIDDEHIIDMYDLDHIKVWFKKGDDGNIYKEGWGNDFFLDKQRIREERLKKILEK